MLHFSHSLLIVSNNKDTEKMNDSSSNDGKILTGKEAEEEITRQFKELENKDKLKSSTTIPNLFTTPEENDGEKEFNKLLQDNKSRVEYRIHKIRTRAMVNEAFVETMKAVKWSDERLFATCIAVLKDEANDPKLRDMASKAYNHIMKKAIERYRIDSDKLYEAIQAIKVSWERDLKLPWNCIDEILTENRRYQAIEEFRDSYKTEADE